MGEVGWRQVFGHQAARHDIARGSYGALAIRLTTARPGSILERGVDGQGHGPPCDLLGPHVLRFKFLDHLLAAE